MGAPKQAPACLLALCGLPGAGKSTLCRALVAHVAALPQLKCTCVCFDAVEQSLSGDQQRGAAFDAARWKLAREEALSRLDAALAGAAASQAPLLVIADDTAHLTSMRHDLLQLARTHCAAYVQLYVRAPPELARRRNEGRGAGERVPADVFARMVAAFEAPDASVREFEQATVVTDAAAELDAAAVWQRVASAWGGAAASPPTPQELAQQRADGQAANSASWMHAWDVGARRAVSEIVTQAEPHARAQLALQLNECRRRRLHQLQADGVGVADVEQSLAELRAQLLLLAGAELTRTQMPAS